MRHLLTTAALVLLPGCFSTGHAPTTPEELAVEIRELAGVVNAVATETQLAGEDELAQKLWEFHACLTQAALLADTVGVGGAIQKLEAARPILEGLLLAVEHDPDRVASIKRWSYVLGLILRRLESSTPPGAAA